MNAVIIYVEEPRRSIRKALSTIKEENNCLSMQLNSGGTSGADHDDFVYFYKLLELI